MPLSEIANATLSLPLAPRIGLTTSATPPASVNFTALSIRFSSAARSRTGSPITSAGSFSEISTSACRPLAAARPASESPALRASARRSNRSCRIPAAASPLAASTNKVAKLARCSAPALMVSTQRFSRSSRSDVANRSLMARIPVNGVRTSCANAASAASTMPGVALLMAGFLTARFLTAGLRALPAATREARFLGGRCLEGRVERFERDLAAMIPLSPALRHHATAGLPESPRSAVFLLPIGLSAIRPPHHGNRPTRRRMSAGLTPEARSSRKPVAAVDFESFCPAPSRMRRWCL